MTINHGEPRIRRLPLRNRRTLDGNGQEAIASTLVCPARERSVPVAACESCDSDDRGIVPGGDPARVTAADIMSGVVIALHESANIGQAASLMAFEGIHRLPVVSDEGEVVGILSSLDVLRWFGRQSGYLIPERSARTPPPRG